MIIITVTFSGFQKELIEDTKFITNYYFTTCELFLHQR